MTVMTDEKKPLLPTATPTAESQPIEHAFALPSESARGWSGHLLACFGNGDQVGVSSYAYVKLLSPLAWGHNVQRALKWSFWKHALVFMLLFSLWGYTFLGAYTQVAVECGPHPPHPPHPKHHPEPKLPGPKEPQPKPQQFLTGATFNPAFAAEKAQVEPSTWESKTEESGQMVSLDPLENPALQSTQINSQILEAKNQALSGMAQLGMGRKLLHKHKDDDDDEQKKARKAAKKEKKLKEKMLKEAEREDDDDDDEPEHHEAPHHHHEHGPESPACIAATRTLGFWALAMIVSSIMGVVYAIRVRTAMREKFGIPGSKCKDAAAWIFCGPCALCQETRTLAHNNVHDGVWFGETVLATPAGHPFQPAVLQPAPTKA